MEVQPLEPTFSWRKREQLSHGARTLILDAVCRDKPRGRKITTSVLQCLKNDSRTNKFFPIVHPMPTESALAVKEKCGGHNGFIVTGTERPMNQNSKPPKAFEATGGQRFLVPYVQVGGPDKFGAECGCDGNSCEPETQVPYRSC